MGGALKSPAEIRLEKSRKKTKNGIDMVLRRWYTNKAVAKSAEYEASKRLEKKLKKAKKCLTRTANSDNIVELSLNGRQQTERRNGSAKTSEKPKKSC